jgi:hypothetical protein
MVRAEVVSVLPADPPNSAASLSSQPVLRESPPSTARPVPICPRRYILSPGYGCIGPNDGDDAEDWPGCNLAVVRLGSKNSRQL